jgi:hypothetical protein
MDKKVRGGDGKFVPRQEFKNFSPIVAAKWVIRQSGGRGTSGVVSFHTIRYTKDYMELYLYFKEKIFKH